MRRSAADLTARYDLLVVGGGVHGLFAAYDAAQRGLSVALVERDDFGSGLSFNHQRTLHGGVRDVGGLRFRKARRQVVERRAWAVMAPHLIRPLPFLIGTYGLGMRSKPALRVGLGLFDLVGRHRNRGVSSELHLPRTRLERAATTKRLFPGIAERGLTGGAIWYDYQTVAPDRLCWAIAAAAIGAGATLVNYAEVTAPLKEGARVVGTRVRDRRTGREHDVLAAGTLLAAGSDGGPLAAAFGVAGSRPLIRAMNMLIDRPARDIAVAAAGPSGRMLTLVPWRGLALVGTFQSRTSVEAGETTPSREVVEEMLLHVNATFPRLAATREDVRLIHHGVIPAVGVEGALDLLPESVITRHATGGVPGLVSLTGAKFTTARYAAEHAVDAICAEIGRPHGHCRTGQVALPHADVADAAGRLEEEMRARGVSLDRDVFEYLASWYGTEAAAVLSFSAEHQLLDRLSAAHPVLAGEIAYAVEHAAAERLSDAVMRRTSLGATGHPGRQALARAAEVMGARLGWPSAQQDAETLAAEDRYRVP